MKQLYIFLFITITIQCTYAQPEWQEHLAYDNRSYNHLGHLVVDGEITLLMGNETVPMNTLETIKGNVPRTADVIRDYFTFEAKTTRTGLDSKEILLINAHDYDIPGYGAFSIHKRDNTIDIRDIQGNLDAEPPEYITAIDAHLIGGPLDRKECITYDTRYLLSAEDIILSETDLTESFAFHEGLNGETYQISGGIMTKISIPLNGNLDLGTYDKLYNNSYKNQFIEVENSSFNTYSYTDLSFINSSILMSEPIDIQFDENGFYYLVESEENYAVFYYSDDDLDSELFYELPKTDEIESFNVYNIEVIGEDIYFLGIWASPLISERFSYVQKRTINKDFTPVRKDIELVSATATREPLSEYEDKYNYMLTVKNLSQDTIHHFTAYSMLYFDFGPDQFAQKDAVITLAPGETQEVEGEFLYYSFALSKLTFKIAGVDFGLDSDYSNNTFTADVITLSNKETVLKEFSISPNISTDFITLKGNLSEIESITITDIKGQKLVIPNEMDGMIDISLLPKGQFWLEIITRNRLEQHPFMKI